MQTSQNYNDDISSLYKLFLLSLMHGIVHGVMIIFPVVLDPVRQSFGWSVQQIGWVATVGYGVFGLISIPAGWLIDKLNRSGLLAVVMVGLSVGLLIMSFSFSGGVFILGWIIVGVFAGMYHPLGLSIIAGDFKENRARALGWHGVGGNLTLAFAPLVLGTVASAFSWRASFILGAGASFGVFLLFITRIKTVNLSVEDASSGKLTQLKKIWPVLLAYGLIGFIYRGVITFIPYSISRQWGGELTLGPVGGLTTVVILVGIGGQLLGGRVADKYNFWRLFSSQVFVFTFLLFLLPLVADYGFLVGLILWSVVYFSTQPVMNNYFAKFGEKQNHGRLYGIAYFVSFGVGSLGSGFAGTLVHYFGLYGLFWGLASVSAVVIFLLVHNRNYYELFT